jgi:hypothetical protein
MGGFQVVESSQPVDSSCTSAQTLQPVEVYATMNAKILPRAKPRLAPPDHEASAEKERAESLPSRIAQENSTGESASRFAFSYAWHHGFSK